MRSLLWGARAAGCTTALCGHVDGRCGPLVYAAAFCWISVWAIAALVGSVAASAAGATTTIRTSPVSRVPKCVTPDRLMAFIVVRNHDLTPKFRDIALHYKKHGEAWAVRWDYAFFQMVLETNYLMFRRGNGTPGDVRPDQNNFAGLGTTGNGVPGDSYPDVGTGVLAQIQHLVVYSGERIGVPVGIRTRLKQDDILRASHRIARRRPMSFEDLSGRWAADRRYGRSIESIAERYRELFCAGREARWPAHVSPAAESRREDREGSSGAVGLANDAAWPVR